jgi:hypothetical protein
MSRPGVVRADPPFHNLAPSHFFLFGTAKPVFDVAGAGFEKGSKGPYLHSSAIEFYLYALVGIVTKVSGKLVLAYHDLPFHLVVVHQLEPLHPIPDQFGDLIRNGQDYSESLFHGLFTSLLERLGKSSCGERG